MQYIVTYFAGMDS